MDAEKPKAEIARITDGGQYGYKYSVRVGNERTGNTGI